MKLTMPSTTSVTIPVNQEKIDQIMRMLGNETGRLARSAASYRRGTEAKPPRFTRDRFGSAADVSRQIKQVAGSIGSSLNDGGRRSRLGRPGGFGRRTGFGGRARFGRNARAWTTQLGQVRIVVEPARRRTPIGPALILVVGMTAVLALLYFLDRRRGGQRRQMLRDRLSSVSRLREAADEQVEEVEQIAESTAESAAAELESGVQDETDRIQDDGSAGMDEMREAVGSSQPTSIKVG